MTINWTGLNILDFIAATFVALLLWFLDKQKKPHLTIGEAQSSELDLPQGKYKIVNLKVKNDRKSGLTSKFFNQTATQVRASIIFKDFESKNKLFELIGRWNTTREPLTPDYSKADPGLALTSQREVISPGEEITLSIAIKKDKSNKCFPFNNESYLHLPDFSKPEWELSDDKILVSVKIQSAEIETDEINFILINKSVLSQFSISSNKN